MNPSNNPSQNRQPETERNVDPGKTTEQAIKPNLNKSSEKR